MGQIVFYEGNGGSQDICQSVDDSPRQNFRADPNDEARSVKLLNVRPGCIITVFDNPDGKRDDDFCVITVKNSSPEYTVGTFERSYEYSISIVLDHFVVFLNWIKRPFYTG